MWNSLTLDPSPKMEREDEEIDFKIKANFTVAYLMQRFFMKIFWACPEGRAFRCNLPAGRQVFCSFLIKGFPLQSLTLVPQVVLFVAIGLKIIC